MGKHIKPASRVEEEGRRVDLRDTLPATRNQLNPGEELVAVVDHRSAFLICGARDFASVKITEGGIGGRILGLYAISSTLAATAR